jgi:hypothetical protein
MVTKQELVEQLLALFHLLGLQLNLSKIASIQLTGALQMIIPFGGMALRVKTLSKQPTIHVLLDLKYPVKHNGVVYSERVLQVERQALPLKIRGLGQVMVTLLDQICTFLLLAIASQQMLPSRM